MSVYRTIGPLVIALFIITFLCIDVKPQRIKFCMVAAAAITSVLRYRHTAIFLNPLKFYELILKFQDY